MKELKELKLEDLSVEQKLGMAMIAFIWEDRDAAYAEQMIKNHALGGVWVLPRGNINDHIIQHLKELADYPLLFFTDAESGFDEYTIGRHNAIGVTDSEELAYTFGKVTAATAAKHGYNVICNPVLDMTDRNSVCGGTMRAYGSDKVRVAQLAAAEARGMHDGGCLTIGKHYPGKHKAMPNSRPIDAHMAETYSLATKEDLLDYNLYPYMELDKMGLLDGVMMSHSRLPNIDPDFPTSLSRHTIQILRDTGFKGLVITDALCMMGIVAKFGAKRGIGLAVGNAGAAALPFRSANEDWMTWLRECYDEGLVPDERLDQVVQDILNMQHKLLSLPQGVELTDKEYADFSRINTDSVFARTDEGLTTALDRDGKYHFAILTEAGTPEEVVVDTFKGKWYNPYRIRERLQELFPNATFSMLSEFPTSAEVERFLNKDVEREVVFVTFCFSQAYVGEERFTPRIISLMDAMQVSNRISTVLHFGNPFLLEELPHIPRILAGTISTMGVEAGLNVLAGEYPAKGKLTYDIKLK